jgi:hypothetical protein
MAYLILGFLDALALTAILYWWGRFTVEKSKTDSLSIQVQGRDDYIARLEGILQPEQWLKIQPRISYSTDSDGQVTCVRIGYVAND